MPKLQTKSIPLDDIRINGGTQLRATGTDEGTADEYAEAYRDGKKLPPPVVFHDGQDYWLASGFHRFLAHKKLSRKSMGCEVRKGTLREAVLFAVGENADHGLRRTTQDKRRAVETLLSDPEWWKWADRKIARHCRVSHTFVAGIRQLLPGPLEVSKEGASGSGCQMRKVERNGTTYTMDTAAIGGAGTAQSEPVERFAGSDDDRLPPADVADQVEDVSLPPADAALLSGQEPSLDEKRITDGRAKHAAGETDWRGGDKPVSNYSDEHFEGEPGFPAEQEDAVLDELGKPVPKRLLEVFEARDVFQQTIREINAARRGVEAIAELKDTGGRRFRPSDAIRELENAKSGVKVAQPYAVCPNCKGQGCQQGVGKGAGCDGGGWLDWGGYHNSPYKEKWKKQAADSAAADAESKDGAAA